MEGGEQIDMRQIVFRRNGKEMVPNKETRELGGLQREVFNGFWI